MEVVLKSVVSVLITFVLRNSLEEASERLPQYLQLLKGKANYPVSLPSKVFTSEGLGALRSDLYSKQEDLLQQGHTKITIFFATVWLGLAIFLALSWLAFENFLQKPATET